MTRQEFEKLFDAWGMPASLFIVLADGRAGLCSHWSDDGILVDPSPRISDSEQVRVPWEKVSRHPRAQMLMELRNK